jgi:hypothetical protein
MLNVYSRIPNLTLNDRYYCRSLENSTEFSSHLVADGPYGRKVQAQEYTFYFSLESDAITPHSEFLVSISVSLIRLNNFRRHCLSMCSRCRYRKMRHIERLTLT